MLKVPLTEMGIPPPPPFEPHSAVAWKEKCQWTKTEKEQNNAFSSARSNIEKTCRR